MTQPQTLDTRVEGPSTLIASAIRMYEPLSLATTRLDAFPVAWQGALAGIGMDRYARQGFSEYLDDRWRATARVGAPTEAREVIIGSGFHAAVYAAIRVQSGFPRPIVLERGEIVGGAFAMAGDAGFYLNSSNRPGPSGITQRLGVNLNYLPGAPVQVDQLSGEEYPTSADMAFVIRATLAQYADVITSEEVTEVDDASGSSVKLTLRSGNTTIASRVIDARGLGSPRVDVAAPNGTGGYVSDRRVLTFPQFMQRMSGTWPLQGVRRVAVAGDGDSAKCAVEALLGLGPTTKRFVTGLDRVERVDWYAPSLPTTFDDWATDVRGRYIRIGRQLRAGEYGSRLAVVQRRMPVPAELPGSVSLEGKRYDLVVMCTGNREDTLPGAQRSYFGDFYARGSEYAVAQKHFDFEMYRVGPHAYLPFNRQEALDGLTGITNNRVSMFRTGPMTATLAATLPPVEFPEDGGSTDDVVEYDPFD